MMKIIIIVIEENSTCLNENSHIFRLNVKRKIKIMLNINYSDIFFSPFLSVIEKLNLFLSPLY